MEKDLSIIPTRNDLEEVVSMKVRTTFILVAFCGGIILGVGSLTIVTAFLSTTLDKTTKLVGQGAGVVQIIIAILLLRYAINRIR